MADDALSPQAVAELLDAAARRDERSVLATLARAAISEDERLEVGAGSPADRVLTATVAVRADLLWPLRRPLCAAWIGAAGALYAVPADVDSLSLIEGPNWRVTQALAAALGIGPRPRAAHVALLVTTEQRLHELLDLGPGADPDAIAAALELDALEPADAGELAELAGTRPAHWRIEVRWGRAWRALHVLDREETPLWLLGERPGEVLVGGPSTPTTLWRGLSTMLPTDQEVEAERGEHG